MLAPALLPSCPRLKILRAIWGERNTTVIQTILMIEKIDHCRDVPAAHHLINLRQAACFEQRRDLRPFAHALWTAQHRPARLIGREQRQRVQCFVTGGTAAGSAHVGTPQSSPCAVSLSAEPTEPVRSPVTAS